MPTLSGFHTSLKSGIANALAVNLVMAFFPVATGALGHSREPCSSQNATALSRSFASKVLLHAVSAAQMLSVGLPPVWANTGLAQTTRKTDATMIKWADLIQIPPVRASPSFLVPAAFFFC